MIREMPCIVCPMSCQIRVETGGNGEIISVTGNTCARGEQYARNELTNPVRMLTSTVRLENGPYRRLPVILSAQIPRERMMDAMQEINRITVCAPVKRGDVVLDNVCGLGVNVLASRSMEQKE